MERVGEIQRQVETEVAEIKRIEGGKLASFFDSFFVAFNRVPQGHHEQAEDD